MTNTRENVVSSLLGGRNTGKTDFLKYLIRYTQLPKVLIVDTYDNPRWRDLEAHDDPEGIHKKIPIIKPEYIKGWKSGIYRIFDADTDLIKDVVSTDLWNCFLIWEDATKYFDSKLTTRDKRALYDTKQRNVDSIYTFHSYRKGNLEIIENSDLLIQKKTGDDPRVIDRKIGNPDIIKVWNKVMQHPDQYHTETIRLN